MKLVEAQEGRRVLDRLVGWETSPVLWRVFGRGQAASAGRVQSVAVRLVVRARTRAHGVPRRPVERPRGRARSRTTRRSAPRSSSSTASASPKAATSIPRPGRLAADDGRRDREVVLLDAAEARGARRPAARRAVHGRVGRVDAVHRAAAGSVHHVDAAAGVGPQAALRRGAHDVDRAAPLRARATSPTCEPTAPTCRSRRSPRRAAAIREQYGEEYLPAEPRVVPQQGEERAGGARGDPPRRRPHPHARRGARRARRRRAAPLRADLDPHGRVPDVATRAAARSRSASPRTSTANETRDVPRRGQDLRLPRLAPRVRRRRRRGRGAVEDEARLPAVAEGERVACNELAAGRRTRRSRRRATPRRAS